MNRKTLPSLLGFLILVFSIQWIGFLLTEPSVRGWYPTLIKPDWTPPSWVFGPVWTLLYFSIALAGWLIWNQAENGPLKTKALFFYGLQLLSNLIWSYFFFYLHNPGLGLLDIALLVGLIGINIGQFLKLYPPAGFLLLPYFLWTLFAFALNVAIWNLNR
jgi:benzodiazapine receptor